MWKILIMIFIAIIALTILKTVFEFIEKKILPNKTEKELDRDSQIFTIIVVVIGVFMITIYR